MSSSPDFEDGVQAGRGDSAATLSVRRTSNAFGSPGTDSTVKRIDLNDLLIRHPEATFMIRAAGDGMHGAGISDGDMLLVDRAVTATHGAIIIAVVEGEMLCRRLEMLAAPRSTARVVNLVAADTSTAPIAITLEAPLEVWGVVIHIIKSLPT
jgi:DNA polymerase V